MEKSRFSTVRKVSNRHKSFQQLTDGAFLLKDDQTEVAVKQQMLLSMLVVTTACRISDSGPFQILHLVSQTLGTPYCAL